MNATFFYDHIDLFSKKNNGCYFFNNQINPYWEKKLWKVFSPNHVIYLKISIYNGYYVDVRKNLFKSFDRSILMDCFYKLGTGNIYKRSNEINFFKLNILIYNMENCELAKVAEFCSYEILSDVVNMWEK